MKTLRLPAFATAASFVIALASAPLHAQPVSDEASAPPVDFPALSLNDSATLTTTPVVALTATPVDLQTSGGIQEELAATGTEALADSGTALPTATNYSGANTKSRQGAISVQSMASAPLFPVASVSGTTIWNDNNYPLTLSIRMPRNAPCLFENQIFTLPAKVGDRTTLGDFNSHVTAWKWEVSTDSGRNWEAVADFTDVDSNLLISGTENPLYLPLKTGMAGWQYRVTADVGPTLRNEDPVLLVSNTVTLPEIKPSHIMSPDSIAIDTAGNLYVADNYNAIWKITAGNKVSLLAGSATHEPGTLDGTGTAARFNSPFGITLHDGKLYVADTGNHAIRVIDTASGVVSTLAGVPGEYGYAEGTGTGARFNNPTAIAADAAGNLYVADGRNTIIRKITPAGVTSHVAGTRFVRSDGGVGSGASMNVFTGTISMHLSDSAGVITGSSVVIRTGSDWSGGYFTLVNTGTLISVGTNGVIWGNVDGGALVSGTDLSAFSGTLSLRGSDISQPPDPETFESEDEDEPEPYYFNYPYGLVVSPSGNVLWVADTYNNNLCKINLADGSIALQPVTIQDDRTLLQPQPTVSGSLSHPTGLRFGADGSLYVADMSNSRIVKIDPATGLGTIVAGGYQGYGYDNGDNREAMFSYPLGLAIGNAGTIYVSDIYNAAIRVIASGTVSTLMLEPLQTSTTNPGNNTGAGTNTGTGNNTNTGAGNNATTGSSESGGGSGGGAPTAWYWLALLALIPLRRTAGSKRP